MTKKKNHSAEFKARVALDAIREGLTLAELAKHSGQISTCKRAALDSMVFAFRRRGQDAGPQVSTAEVEKLHSKIGQLVVEQDFLADASHQFLGTRGKKWLAYYNAERPHSTPVIGRL